MNVTIAYDSSTGKTRQATESMGKTLEEPGHQCQVHSVGKIDPDEVKQADLFCAGTWVKGFFILKQHPTKSSMRFIEEQGNLDGNQAVVFCTYMLAAGSTLMRISQALQANGAEQLS